MSKVITFDKGSKRRLNQVRWKLIELVSLALLAIVMFTMSLFVMLWELRDEHPYQTPTTNPKIRNGDATQP